jgi:subtilisin-like proprotein convertase family protein
MSAVLALGMAFVTVVTFAQPGDRSPFLGGEPAVSNPNFDIRTYKEDPAWEDKADAVDYLAKVRAPAARAGELAVARVTGVALLEAAYRGIRVEANPATRGTELVSAMPGTPLLSAASGDRVATLRGFLAAHADAFGVSQAQVEALELTADYMNPSGNMGYAEFEQQFNGIPVFQGLVRGGFTAKGELVRTTGVLAAGIDASVLPTSPVLGAAQAVSLAAQTVGLALPEGALVEVPSAIDGHVQFGQTAMAGEPSAWLVYFPLEAGVARLAWATQLLGNPEGFLTVLDAETGTMLFRKSLTNYQTQSATYNIYTSDSPAPSSPTPALPGANFQAPYVARTNATLIGNEAPNTFNNLGWMTDGTNLTNGNNVEAGLDRDGVDGVDPATIAVGSPNRVFTATYTPGTTEPLTAEHQRGSVINMFYWTNRFHDLTYLLGFNEASRNFQNDNFGRGGVAGDRIRAEGQDSSGTNNANMLTPADGGRGRMQMFIWTGPTPDKDGTIDQDIVIHELTHGLSNRLHNNASGLSGTMSGGMGEGWSDFYARALLADASENVNGIYTIGGWATHLAAAGFTDNYYYGIRRFPYAVRTTTGGPSNRPHNPLTFADIDPAQINLTDGAFARGPFGSATAFAVHNIGEVWAMALFEVRARFITRLGFATGNQRFLQFVTDGMKLDPVSPTLLQGRDAILAAAVAGGNVAADIDDIWTGFATRGMGVTASVVNAATGTVVENFLRPGDPVPTFTINDVSLAEGNAGVTNFIFTVTRANPGPGESRVSWATANGTATSSETAVTAAGAITINDNSSATPYPAAAAVAGVTGTITSLGVRINGLSHTFPGDIDMMLRGPGGQTVMLMSDAGGTNDLVGATLTFRDGAAPLTTGVITSGETYAPTDLTPGESLPAPAPAAPYGANLAVFNGTNPNGTWQLFVADDAAADTGSISGGFTLLIGTSAAGDYQPGSGQLVFGPGVSTQTITVAVNGDTVVEPNETFFVNLSSPVGAVIGDAQGIGTIINDDGVVTTVQPPTNARIDNISGTTVTVRWDAPVLGPSPTGYVLEGGVSPGEVLASLPTGSNGPVFTFAAPVGSFHLRIHALDGATRSGASNEVPLHVVVPVAPSAPTSLTGMAVGDAVALAWKNTFGGGAPTGMVVDVTGTLAVSLPLGPTEGFSFVGVPGGTYTFTMRATNGGGSSPPSNPVTLSFPAACSGTPQAPTNVVAYRLGNTAFVLWDPPASGAAATSYVLNVSGAFNGSFGTPGRALSGVVGPGTYNLSVVGTNACGTGVAAPTVVLVVP